nr:hypothetical protein HK105_007509 [Polyrhizophydium stewartii]
MPPMPHPTPPLTPPIACAQTCQTLYDDGALDTSVRPLVDYFLDTASDGSRTPSPLAGIARAVGSLSGSTTPQDPRSPIDAAIETAVLAFDALTPNLDSLAPTSLDATSAMTSSATIVSSPSPSPLPNGTSKAVSILPSQASLAVATVSAGTAVEPHRDAKPALFRKKPVPPPSPSAVRLAKARSLRPETVVDEMYPVVALPLRVVDAAWDKSVDITAGVLSMCFAPVRTTRMLVRRGTGW